MENLLFLALVAIVGIIRWAVQAAENKRNAEAARHANPQPSAPIQRAPAETEEERIRRFMEALGVPKGEPPPVRKTTPRPPRKIMPVDSFPIPRGGDLLPPVPPPLPVPVPDQARTPERPTPSLPLPTPQTSMLAPVQREPVETPEFVVEEDTRHLDALADAIPLATLPNEGRTPTRTGLAARLATAEGLRDAMVLREIIGPPRSMQSSDPAHAS